jgi:nicotinamide riboside transporter PnuC
MDFESGTEDIDAEKCVTASVVLLYDWANCSFHRVRSKDSLKEPSPKNWREAVWMSLVCVLFFTTTEMFLTARNITGMTWVHVVIPV